MTIKIRFSRIRKLRSKGKQNSFERIFIGMSNSGANNEKKIINYSRDYRHLNRSLAAYIIQSVVVLGVLITGYLLVYTKFSYYISEFAAFVLSKIFGYDTGIREMDYLPKLGGVYCVTMDCKSPSFSFSLISLIVTLFLLVVFIQIKTKRKPVMIFVSIALFIHLVSSAFFLIFGADRFPYSLNDFSELYMKQQIIIWLMIMVVYVFSTSLITHVVWLRIISFVKLAFISVIFGIVRYIVYMVILSKFTLIFMAVLYFMFGVLVDMMIMVGVYSIFMKKASEKFKNRSEVKLWKW